MERRSFIQASVATVAAAGLAQSASAAAPNSGAAAATDGTVERGGMKYRVLGRTGQLVSLIGLGGFHLARPGGPTADEATAIVRTAIDQGVNFCDNCWDYNGGESEVRLGLALRDGYRQKAFLMTKIDGRTAAAATRQLDESLRRLQTDHLDLLQFHEIIRPDDPDRVFAAGGALEAVLRARDQGKLRYIGFTGHKSPAIHRRMFEVAAAHNFQFDSVQMPLNVMDAHYDSFEQIIIPIAQAHNTGILAMKAMGDHFILDAGVASPIELLHYPMSLPASVVVTGIDSMKILDQALQAVRSYQPPTPEARAALLARTLAASKDGQHERYKVSHHFDGTVQNPHWLI